MIEVSSSDISEALNITGQQYEIIRTINMLEEKRRAATPINIEQAYFERYAKAIATSNLFRQLAQLKKRGFIGKNTKSRYRVEYESIEASLMEDSKRLAKKKEHIERIAKNIRVFLGSGAHTDDEMGINYMGYEKLFKSMTMSMKKADRYYITAKYPGLAYTLGPYARIGRENYLEVLSRRCIDEKKMHVTYLTALDESYPKAHIKRLHADKKQREGELQLIRDSLKNIANHPSVSVYHSKNPYGVDIAIPCGPELEEVYFFIRDSDFEVTSGIRIINRQIAQNQLIMFEALCSQSKLLGEGKAGLKFK